MSNSMQKFKILYNAIPLICPGPQICVGPFHTHQNNWRLLISTESQNELPISDHNLTVTKLLYIWNKYTNNETMEITISSGICKTIYHNDSYLLFGRKKLKSSAVLHEYTFVIFI